MSIKLAGELKKQKKSTAQVQLEIVGTLGISLGGQKLVEVPNRKSIVYVKLRDNQNELIQAFNNKVAPSYGLPVIVQRQGNRYVVLNVDTLRYQSNWNSFAPFLAAHGNTHSFDPDSSGGGDVVWVHPRQFMPSLIIPSGSLGAPNVLLSSYTLRDQANNWKYIGNTGTQNLTPYKPSIPTGATMALVYLDTVSGNPYFVIGSGTFMHAHITGSAQVVPYIPVITNPAWIPLAAVRLVTGTNTIGWDNIYDVRQFLHPTSTGTGGGGGGNSTGTIQLLDNGADPAFGPIHTLDFRGNVNLQMIIPGIARVNITGTNAAVNLTGSSIGLGNRIVGTTSVGLLYTIPDIGWNGNGTNDWVEFGFNVVGKETNAGRMGYQIFQNGFFEIVGAGTSAGNRWVLAYDNLKVNSLMQANGYQNLGLQSMFVYLNATGSMVNASNASGKVFITGSDRFMVVGDDDNSYLIRAEHAIVNLSAESPRVYTATGTHTWNKPDNLRYIIVEMVGGGGGGGGAEGTTSNAAGAAGGGGAGYSKKKIATPVLGATETITVGGGGAGGPSTPSTGATGGQSSFGSHASANGGAGGGAQNAGTAAAFSISGLGGSATNGDINIPGKPGLYGTRLDATASIGGEGGASLLGFGARPGVSANADGADAGNYGGGGSGARTSNNNTDRPGGKGGNGVVIVWEYITGNV
jgi:hypothetical protein